MLIIDKPRGHHISSLFQSIQIPDHKLIIMALHKWQLYNLFYFIIIKSIMTSSWLNLASNSKPWTSPLQLFQRCILLNIASILVLATNKVVKKLTQLFFCPFYFKDKNQLPIGDPEKLKDEKKINKRKK